MLAICDAAAESAVFLNMNIKVESRSEGFRLVTLTGRWDLAGVQAAETPLSAAGAGCKVPLALDLAQVTILVSLGIRQILTIAKSYNRAGTAFALYRPAPLVRDTLFLANLGQVIRICETWEELLTVMCPAGASD